ncbi:oxidized low-density lipoprotein receptor 1-like [Ylistrum balloti]|uniref:oxidized low-density lipoprotein receptor 1-like n=1 Tax=Ylistrum balloti TaxID=509963 RepID=UPI002905DA5E|nr:oxidized low-density lipoprotein receptor 1-like [Ylistrum balloti]
MAMPLLFCLLVDINLLSLTLQQSLLPSKGSDDTSNVMPMVNQLANNSMSIAWIKIQDEMKIYMENLTSRLDELSEKASELRKALDYPFVLSGPKKTCPTDYLLHDRFCYLFHPRPVPWFVAMVTCLGINAMLARPDTPEKDRFLEEQCLRTGQSHWVGATDMEKYFVVVIYNIVLY